MVIFIIVISIFALFVIFLTLHLIQVIQAVITITVFINSIIVLFVIFITLWLIQSVRTTFVVMRSERTEKEKKLYPKITVIHTYLFASQYVLLLIIYLLWEYTGLWRGDAGEFLKGLAIVNAVASPATALAGIFAQKSIYGKVLCILFLFFVLLGVLIVFIKLRFI